VQGTRTLRNNNVEGTYVFIMPPSLKELESRLRRRQTDDDEAIRRRLEIARQEMDMAYLYDHVIINSELSAAVTRVRELLGLEAPADGGEHV
jgi:guanylate kinase